MAESELDSGITSMAHAAIVMAEARPQTPLLKAGALQYAILTSANFSIIATDEKGIIQLFNVGAERMLGYTAAEVVNKISPSDMHDPEEVKAHALSLSKELSTPIAPGFEALAFKASRGIEDIYDLTYISSVPTFFRGERPGSALLATLNLLRRVEVIDLLELFRTWSNSGFVGFHRDYATA